MNSKAHILIVDDDSAVGEQLEALFTASGYKVLVASAAEHALQFRESEDIDLVITDRRLPGTRTVEHFAHVDTATDEFGARYLDVRND